MIFSTHVALPKHNIHVKYHVKIYVYSDVTAFYNPFSRYFFFIFYFCVLSGLGNEWHKIFKYLNDF